MAHPQEQLDQQLRSFRKKFYVDKLIRGVLILALLTSSILFIALLSEGLFGFSSQVRKGIVYTLGLIFLGVLGTMVLWPVFQLFNLTRSISDMQIAGIVRDHFPEVNDKLINFLQLRSQSFQSNSLAAAAIDRKALDISPVSLSSAINLKLNNRYLLYLLIPLLLLALTWGFNPQMMSGSSHRLANFDKDFAPPAPFGIQLSNVPGELVAGDELPLEVVLTDPRELPSELFVYIRKESENQFIDFNLTRSSDTEFSYTLSDLKENFSFYVGNPEVSTEVFNVDVLRRPFIKTFSATVQYPAYTRLSPEKLDPNVGDFRVIKGSTVRWDLEPQGDVENAFFVSNDSTAFEYDDGKGSFFTRRRMMNDIDYFISLNSKENISNIDTVRYHVDILQDRFPSIYVFSPNADFLIDLEEYMPLDLEIADDFGFSKIGLFYRFVKSGGNNEISEEYAEYPLSFTPDMLVQPQNYLVDLNQLGMESGDEIEYFIKVWDNDGVSGPKASTSGVFKIVYPTLDAKYDELAEEQEAIQDNLEEMKRKADELNQSYQKMQQKLLEQKRLSFDDKKELQRIAQEHQQMMEQIAQTQEKMEQTSETLEENQMISQQTLENFEELNEFMEEMEDPEIEEMLKEMQERMENLNPEELLNQLEKLKNNDRDIKKSMERALELIKQLEVQQKVDELRNKLENMKEKQDLLNEKLEKADSKKDFEQNAERQEELLKKMEELREELEKLSEMKDNTLTPDKETMEDVKKDAQDASEEMQDAQEKTEDTADQMKDDSEKQDGEQSDSEQGQKQDQENQQSGEQSDQDQQKQENNDQQQSDQNQQEEQQEQNESNQGEQSEQQEQQKQSQNLPMQKQASQSQKNASQKMQEMSESLSNMQMNMQQQQDQQNLEHLRDLLENLLKLSFDQEDLRDEVKDLKYGDPSLKEKSQQQKKLQDDMELVSDSLESLANKVFQIKKFVLDESQKISDNMERSQIFFRNKQTNMVEYHQQSAMTSVNNLANMLSDVMQQIQQQMMSGMSGAMCPKPGQNNNGMQQLGQKQQQLNQQMQQMMNQGNMDPKRLQEMAAQQEAIRQQLKESHEKIKENGGKALGDMQKIMQDMIQSETDLVNKKLTHETMMRQQQILSRLLQADKSVRQRELDQKRKSRTGKEFDQQSPDELPVEELKNRIRQELLKSNKLEYSNDFMILIEQYYKKLEGSQP